MNTMQKQIKDIAVFDDTLTCKIFGYETSREYYDACSSAPYLRTVKTPLLLVCSEDDEVTNTMPIDLVPKECKENPYVAAVVTRNGGHVGYEQWMRKVRCKNNECNSSVLQREYGRLS